MRESLTISLDVPHWKPEDRSCAIEVLRTTDGHEACAMFHGLSWRVSRTLRDDAVSALRVTMSKHFTAGMKVCDNG